jgi:hypothetical protein
MKIEFQISFGGCQMESERVEINLEMYPEYFCSARVEVVI